MPPLRVARAWVATVILLSIGQASAQVPSTRPTRAAAAASIRNPLSDHVDWMSLHEAGWRAMNKGWYDIAEREFAAAIRVAKRPGASDPRLLARSYSSFAWALQKQGRNADAEPLAKWALETREANFPANAEPVARSLNQMATLYLALNRTAEAEPLLRRAVAMDAGTSITMKQEQAQSESLLGLTLVTQRRYAQAEGDFTRSIALREASQGSGHPETGDELNNLGWACLEQGKLVEARASLEKSLKILEQGRGVQDPSVARVLDGLARVDAEQNDLSAAEAKYLRLIAIYEKLGSGQQTRLNDGLKRYANLLDRMGRSADAGQVRGRLPSPNGKIKAGATGNANFISPKYPAPVNERKQGKS